MAKQFAREEAAEALIEELERSGIEIPNEILDEVLQQELGPQYSRGPWHRFTRAVTKWYYYL